MSDSKARRQNFDVVRSRRISPPLRELGNFFSAEELSNLYENKNQCKYEKVKDEDTGTFYDENVTLRQSIEKEARYCLSTMSNHEWQRSRTLIQENYDRSIKVWTATQKLHIENKKFQAKLPFIATGVLKQQTKNFSKPMDVRITSSHGENNCIQIDDENPSDRNEQQHEVPSNSSSATNTVKFNSNNNVNSNGKSVFNRKIESVTVRLSEDRRLWKYLKINMQLPANMNYGSYHPISMNPVRASAMICTLPKYQPLPRCTTWIKIRKNMFSADESILRALPYFGDDDDTGVDITNFDKVPGQFDSEILGEAEEFTVVYIIDKYKRDANKWKREIYSALHNVLEISISEILKAHERVADGHWYHFHLKPLHPNLNSSPTKIFMKGSKPVLTLEEVSGDEQLQLLSGVTIDTASIDEENFQREGLGIGLNIVNADTYEEIVANYRDFFCRRCYVYNCPNHFVQHPLPRNRVDPPPPFPFPISGVRLPSDRVREHRRAKVQQSTSSNNNSNNNNSSNMNTRRSIDGDNGDSSSRNITNSNSNSNGNDSNSSSNNRNNLENSSIQVEMILNKKGYLSSDESVLENLIVHDTSSPRKECSNNSNKSIRRNTPWVSELLSCKLPEHISTETEGHKQPKRKNENGNSQSSGVDEQPNKRTRVDSPVDGNTGRLLSSISSSSSSSSLNVSPTKNLAQEQRVKVDLYQLYRNKLLFPDNPDSKLFRMKANTTGSNRYVDDRVAKYYTAAEIALTKKLIAMHKNYKSMHSSADSLLVPVQYLGVSLVDFVASMIGTRSIEEVQEIIAMVHRDEIESRNKGSQPSSKIEADSDEYFFAQDDSSDDDLESVTSIPQQKTTIDDNVVDLTESNYMNKLGSSLKSPTRPKLVKRSKTHSNKSPALDQFADKDNNRSKATKDRVKVDLKDKNSFKIPYEACDHDGPCVATNPNCVCAQNRTFCEKYCACTDNCVYNASSGGNQSMSCKNKFNGCNCKRGACQTKACPCFSAARACDPDLCFSCGASIPSVWWPVIENYDECVPCFSRKFTEKYQQQSNKEEMITFMEKYGHTSGRRSTMNGFRGNEYLQGADGVEVSEVVSNMKANFKQCNNYHFAYRKGKKIAVGISKIQGYGGYLMEPVTEKNTFITEYMGEIISVEESERRGLVYDKLGVSYLFTLNGDMQVVDATRKGSKARFINHAPDNEANCYPRIMQVNGDYKIALFSKRPIAVGEELSFNYGYSKSHAPEWAQTSTAPTSQHSDDAISKKNISNKSYNTSKKCDTDEINVNNRNIGSSSSCNTKNGESSKTKINDSNLLLVAQQHVLVIDSNNKRVQSSQL